jgi:membrane protein implicated in regulation of membrane protease activity
MQMVADLYAAQPFWIWMGFGALLLAIEAATGTGWLLWAAASAAAVALITLAGVTGAPLEIGLFAALTLVTTLVSRRLVGSIHGSDSDINDQRLRLVGKVGRAAGAFVEGQGRVFVDGSEWLADLEGGGDLPTGVKVAVTGVQGSRLVVRAA